MYGGRKNCSSKRYMPRTISVKRKYLPALSREDSFPSSQRAWRGRRKPEGGGPAGVAGRWIVVVKVAHGGVWLARRVVKEAVAGRVRARSLRDLIVAMTEGG